ncbi:DNA polymerase lambda-like isoform X2 [Paramacrobiotus metropolitanus]|uniref:DNA polymerase lambda-like isoform X2 n=1 Tax=Paramacrobiotus metropolitanus TaxID=2943436 RepID=UPI0024462F34|nr:DNA polymerase lambda-like isoform X2 [Paramacrobiotus metropolitanus]
MHRTSKARASSSANSSVADGDRSRVPTPKPFLHGTVICILPLKLQNARLKILHKRLGESGAAIVSFDTKSKNFPDCTHVLVEERVVFDELFELFAVLSLLNLKDIVGKAEFVRIPWASKCLSGKSKCPEAEFSLNAQFTVLIEVKLEKTKGVKRNHSPERSSEKPAGTVNVTPVSVGSGKKKCRAEAGSSSYESSAEEASDSADGDEDNVSPIAARHLGKYVCSEASSSKAKSLNGHITGPLEELASVYKNNGEEFRSMAYGKVISFLKNHPKQITKVEELNGFRNIGPSIRSKIVEILETGACQKVEEVCQDNEFNQAVKLFCNIHGVSSKTATKWAALVCQQICERWTTIPRDEVALIENTVKEAALDIQEGLTITTCGSYRRGKPTCGDVDILISHPDGKSHRSVFAPLLENLHATGFLTDDLSIGEDGTQKKYLGVCRLPGELRKHRRLDIICVPYSELACALLYFTGSAHFNRSMRSYAHRLNMALSHHSLNKNVIRVKREKMCDGEVLHTPTELSIFEHLGMTFLEPVDRDH